MWRCEDEKMWRWEDVKMRRCEDEKMWRWADEKMWRSENEKIWGWEDVKMRRCEDEKMWRWADVKMSRCEDEQMWRWEDVKMSRCEDEQMWRWADVKMRRCEHEQMRRSEGEKMWRWEDVKVRRCEDKMWRWEDVKMRRCEDEKMFYRPPLLEEPCAQTLSGKNQISGTQALGQVWRQMKRYVPFSLSTKDKRPREIIMNGLLTIVGTTSRTWKEVWPNWQPRQTDANDEARKWGRKKHWETNVRNPTLANTSTHVTQWWITNFLLQPGTK